MAYEAVVGAPQDVVPEAAAVRGGAIHAETRGSQDLGSL